MGALGFAWLIQEGAGAHHSSALHQPQPSTKSTFTAEFGADSHRTSAAVNASWEGSPPVHLGVSKGETMANRTSGLLPEGNVTERAGKGPRHFWIQLVENHQGKGTYWKVAFASSKFQARGFPHLIHFSSLYIPEPGLDSPESSIRIFWMCICHFTRRCRAQVRKGVILL